MQMLNNGRAKGTGCASMLPVEYRPAKKGCQQEASMAKRRDLGVLDRVFVMLPMAVRLEQYRNDASSSRHICEQKVL